MKKAALLVSLLLTPFVAPSPSHAAIERTIQTLLDSCEGSDSHELMRCFAYIHGVANMLDLNCSYSADGHSMPEWMTSNTNAATVGALAQAFKNWAIDNPDKWSDSDFTGVVFAITSTFPCKG